MLGMGMGAGFILAGANAFVIQSAGGRAHSLMNLSQFFFGAGAILGPVMAGVLLGAGAKWQTAYQLAGLIVLLCMGAVLFLLRRTRRALPDASWTALAGILRQGLLWSLALFGALYITLELGVTEWTSEFFVRRLAASPDTAAYPVAILWVGIAAGRLTGALLTRVRQEVLLLAGSLAVPVLLLALILDPWRLGAQVIGFLLGLVMSPIFPTLLAWGGSRSPRLGGSIAGFLAAASVLGAYGLRPVMTMLASWRTLEFGFVFFLMLALLMAGVSAALFLRERSGRRESLEGAA